MRWRIRGCGDKTKTPVNTVRLTVKASESTVHFYGAAVAFYGAFIARCQAVNSMNSAVGFPGSRWSRARVMGKEKRRGPALPGLR